MIIWYRHVSNCLTGLGKLTSYTVVLLHGLLNENSTDVQIVVWSCLAVQYCELFAFFHPL